MGYIYANNTTYQKNWDISGILSKLLLSNNFRWLKEPSLKSVSLLKQYLV